MWRVARAPPTFHSNPSFHSEKATTKIHLNLCVVYNRTRTQYTNMYSTLNYWKCIAYSGQCTNKLLKYIIFCTLYTDYHESITTIQWSNKFLIVWTWTMMPAPSMPNHVFIQPNQTIHFMLPLLN